MLHDKGVSHEESRFLAAVQINNYIFVRFMVIDKRVDRHCYNNIAMKIATKNKNSRMLAFLLDRKNGKHSLFEKVKLC